MTDDWPGRYGKEILQSGKGGWGEGRRGELSLCPLAGQIAPRATGTYIAVFPVTTLCARVNREMFWW